MTLSKFNCQFFLRVNLRTIGFVATTGVVALVTWCSPPSLFAQGAPPKGKFTVEAVKLSDDKARSAKEKEKNAELRGDKAELTALTEYYVGYVIPKLTEAVPAELNTRRREIETDLELVSKNKNKAVRDNFNKKINQLFTDVAKNKAYDPTTRITSMIVLTQLIREPAGKNPPVPDPDVLNELYRVLDPKKLSNPNERELDAMLYIAIKSLEKYLRAQPTNPADGFPDNKQRAFVTRIAEHMTVQPPVPRLLDGHQKMMEQALQTMTLFATKSKGETQKLASEAVLKFIVVVFNDDRSSEWLKEVACACLGQITPSTLTPEEITKLENEIAKFAIKSLKDWRVKIAMSGSLAMSGGMGGGMGGMGGMPGGGDGYGGEGGMGGEGGYGGEGGMGGMGGQPKANANLPPEVRNAKRIIHQRLERIHLALNGFPIKYTDVNSLAKNPPKGLITLVSDNEKPKVQDAIEKLDKLQLSLKGPITNLADFSSTVVRGPLREFRLACVEISGEAKEKVEDDAFNPITNPGSGE